MTETRPLPLNPDPGSATLKKRFYQRFSIDQRIEHIVFLVSFSTLGLTGLIQKFFQAGISQFLLEALGGVEQVRLIHRLAATIMMVVTIYHLVAVLYRVYVRRVSWTMFPGIEDLKNLWDDILYYFGMRNRKAYYGRYNYAEKAEYLAVVWGTVIMAITGFMMWNPIATTRILPGETIPAAKAAHGAEAILAVLAIILWHFYHVHLRHFNKSMFTGKLTHNEMEEEHPGELAQIEAGLIVEEDPGVIQKRKRIYYPVASVLVILLGFSVFRFLTLEKTAIKTIPQEETVAIFVPLTATPRPTPTQTPTPKPGGLPVASDSWEGKYQGLFSNRCGTCHGNTAVGGLSLKTYADALKGGKSGPAIVPGDPDASMVVKVQSAGGHPGQLTQDELDQVIAWIRAGALEK